MRTQPPALDQEVEAEHLGHALIGNDDGEVAFLEQGEGLDRACAGDDVVFLALQRLFEGAEHDRLVVHDQD